MSSCRICGGPGWLVGGGGYGRTFPPEPSVIVQRCDACDQFSADTAAALAYAARSSGNTTTFASSDRERAFAIADRGLGDLGDLADLVSVNGLYQASASDAWVGPKNSIGCGSVTNLVDGLVWIPERTAVAEGLYSPRGLGPTDPPDGPSAGRAEPELTGAQAQAIIEVYAVIPERARKVLLGMPLSAAAAICGRLRDGLKVLDAPADKE